MKEADVFTQTAYMLQSLSPMGTVQAAAFCNFSWAGLSFTDRRDAFHRCTLLSQLDERDHFQQQLFCNLCIILVQWQHGLHEEIAYRLFSTDDAFVILENSTNHKSLPQRPGEELAWVA